MSGRIVLSIKETYFLNRKPLHFSVKFLIFLSVTFLGILMGYSSEWLEYNIYRNSTYRESAVLNSLILVLDNFSVWIFVASIIAYLSDSPISAGIQTFSFFVVMCAAYFIPKHMHYGYAIDLQFIFWVVIAFISIGAAVMIWFSRIGGWVGAVIKSLPIAAILGEFAYTVHHCIDYYSPIPGRPPEPLKWLLQPERILQLCTYAVFIILLLFILAKYKTERLRISLLTLSFGTVISAGLILIF